MHARPASPADALSSRNWPRGRRAGQYVGLPPRQSRTAPPEYSIMLHILPGGRVSTGRRASPAPRARALTGPPRQVRDRSTFYSELLSSDDEALMRRLITDVAIPPLLGVEAALAAYVAAADFSEPFNLARAVVAPVPAKAAAAAGRAAAAAGGAGAGGAGIMQAGGDKRGEAAMYADMLNSMPQFASFGKVRQALCAPAPLFLCAGTRPWAKCASVCGVKAGPSLQRTVSMCCAQHGIGSDLALKGDTVRDVPRAMCARASRAARARWTRTGVGGAVRCWT
jgi:hypothetical protein